ncbi:protein ERGIC-53 [Parasteatoda tepidariorum]|uniref:protein ERGIC-53 n=1 Tax=Parasteatoda tepidariorum TaxID=114398 RepID=UPI00077F8B68|nr:protein ERGIC-53 [Parasteatoda tepidariorum]
MWLSLLLFCFQFIFIYCEIPHHKFEYKYSFKGPYLAQKDGTVPFWEHFGNAIASEEMVRITPSLRSKKGSIWTKNKTNFDWWEVEVVFRVNGRGRLGADGFAFWYTDNKGVEGPVFGSNDHWNGLGVFFDSFDNDGRGNNPYIMAMYNDGTKTFDHQSDGLSQQLAGCQRDFRNKPFPVRAKVEYYKNVLSILFHNGNSNNDDDYELCLRAENVYLPQYGHFGLSAATGGLADDHDALKFLTYSMYPPGTQPTSQNIGDAEKEKFSKEYEEYKEKLEKQKEEYRKEHPDEAKRREMEFNPDEQYESHQQRELQQIFQGQSSIFEILKGLHRKIDEVIGRQERALSMLSAVSTGGIAQHQGGQGMPPPQVGGGLSRHEIEALLGGQRELIQTARDTKSFLTDIHQKTGTIIAKQSEMKPSGGGGIAFESQTQFQDIKDSLNHVKRELATMAAKTQGGPCPVVQPQSCLSPSIFFIFMGVQLVILIGYITYQSNKESQAKKFY